MNTVAQHRGQRPLLQNQLHAKVLIQTDKRKSFHVTDQSEATKNVFDPANLDLRGNYQLLIGAIAPRPIAWVSTLAPDGVRNLAPFSYFMAVTHAPPTLAVAITQRAGRKKDTLANIEALGEFVVNVATLPNAVAVNQSSGEWPPEVDEFAEAGVTAAPSVIVRPPRVAESPINMECRLVQVVGVGAAGSQTGLVIGEIVRWHIAAHLLDERGGIDVARVEAISRLSYDNYGLPVTLFSRPRPKV